MIREPFVPPPSDFSSLLIAWNGLDAAGFAAWEFLPGMRFGERAAWWRGGADRGSEHQGLDICWYLTGEGRRRSLGAGARIPAPWAGEIVAVVDDFLGRSVFVEHGRPDGGGRRLHSVCGHIEPRPGLAVGGLLHDGDEIGIIAAPSGSRPSAPPHLHLTLALIDRGRGPARLDWEALSDTSRVQLLDPLPIVCHPWSRSHSDGPVPDGH